MDMNNNVTDEELEELVELELQELLNRYEYIEDLDESESLSSSTTSSSISSSSFSDDFISEEEMTL